MTFLRNIWADLVEKRLWPVALALLVGIVAVPVMLAKSSEGTVANDPTAPGAVANNVVVAKADKAIALNTAVAATARRNRAGTPRNPFKQLFVVKDTATTTTGGTTDTTGSSTPTSGGTPTTAAVRPRRSRRPRRPTSTGSTCASGRPAGCTRSRTSRASPRCLRRPTPSSSSSE